MSNQLAERDSLTIRLGLPFGLFLRSSANRNQLISVRRTGDSAHACILGQNVRDN